MPGRKEVERQLGLERQQHRDAPAMGLGDDPASCRRRLVEEVDEISRRPGGHQAEGHRHPASAPRAVMRSSARFRPRGRVRTCRRRLPRRCRMPSVPMTPTRVDDLVPRGQARSDRSAVRGLVVLGARGRESDGAGLAVRSASWRFMRAGRPRWPPPRRRAPPWPRSAGLSGRCWRRN